MRDAKNDHDLEPRRGGRASRHAFDARLRTDRLGPRPPLADIPRHFLNKHVGSALVLQSSVWRGGCLRRAETVRPFEKLALPACVVNEV